RGTDHPGADAVPGGTADEPRPTALQPADHHRSQADRHDVHGYGVRVLRARRPARPRHPLRAVGAGAAGGGLQGPVQPAVHDARHDHAADVRHAAVQRLRELPGAAADRCRGHGVPAPEHVRLLDHRLRLADRGLRLPHPSGGASFGWFAYAPLSDTTFSPGLGGDLWVFGLALQGFGTILGSVNFITTILCMRMPGMTMFRMPIFTWNALITAVLVLMAFPPLASALLALGADRRFDANIFDAANGGPVLWQHLFWFFGHPEVYVLALPFFGIATEIIPVFS